MATAEACAVDRSRADRFRASRVRLRGRRAAVDLDHAIGMPFPRGSPARSVIVCAHDTLTITPPNIFARD
jgi:hypothetical protein